MKILLPWDFDLILSTMVPEQSDPAGLHRYGNDKIDLIEAADELATVAIADVNPAGAAHTVGPKQTRRHLLPRHIQLMAISGAVRPRASDVSR